MCTGPFTCSHPGRPGPDRPGRPIGRAPDSAWALAPAPRRGPVPGPARARAPAVPSAAGGPIPVPGPAAPSAGAVPWAADARAVPLAAVPAAPSGEGAPSGAAGAPAAPLAGAAPSAEGGAPAADAGKPSHPGPPQSRPSGFVGRGGARERAEISPQAEAEQSGLCADEAADGAAAGRPRFIGLLLHGITNAGRRRTVCPRFSVFSKIRPGWDVFSTTLEKLKKSWEIPAKV